MWEHFAQQALLSRHVGLMSALHLAESSALHLAELSANMFLSESKVPIANGITRLLACAAEAGTSDALLPAIPILLELSSHSEAAVACTAAHCLATLTEMFPQDAAAGILSGDGLLMLADALQPSAEGSSSNEASSASSATLDPSSATAGQREQESNDIDCMRQEQLLTCLAAACRFQPPVNIMAGMGPAPAFMSMLKVSFFTWSMLFRQSMTMVEFNNMLSV